MSGNFLDPTGSLQRNMNTLIERGRQVAPNLRPSLYFPETYTKIDHYITFTVLKFDSTTRTSTLNSDLPLVGNRLSSVTRTIQTITLPMPAALNTSYSTQYEDKDTSAIEEVIATAASNVRGDPEQSARSLGNNVRNMYDTASNSSLGQNVSSVLEGIRSQMQQLAQNPATQQIAAAGAVAGAAGAVGGILNNPIAANLTGVARNSHKVLLFQGVDRREHRFSFNLSPKNRREAESIQKIIEAFKYHMLPSYGLGNIPAAMSGLASGLGENAAGAVSAISGVLSSLGGITQSAGTASRAFFQYPDVFMIQFNNHRQLFTIGESVLSSFDVNYHPMNYPAYVRSLDTPNVASPAEIVISLTFKETDIMTKEQVKENRR
jgi:hypothetical protein